MKRLISSFWFSALLLLIGIFTSIAAFAEKAGQDDYYPYTSGAKHASSLYNGPVSYIVFGVVIAALAFLGYRYWKDSNSITE